MEGIEIEGKTIDEAIEKACSEFQVPREKLNIEIIAEGSPGFLGLGAKKARIRAGIFSIDMTLDDVLRVQHLLGQKARESGRARADMLAGIPVDPAPLADVPRLVVGSGLDGSAAAVAAEQLASWLGAEHEQYGAHSHYGMVLGTESHRQVADRVRTFLETHHL